MVKDYMKLVYKYDRIDFFGTHVYTEDFTYVRPDTFKKAAAALKRDTYAAIELHDLFFKCIVIYWDSTQDHSNDIVTVKFYDHANSYSVEKMAFSKMKKIIYGYMQEPEYMTA